MKLNKLINNNLFLLTLILILIIIFIYIVPECNELEGFTGTYIPKTCKGIPKPPAELNDYDFNNSYTLNLLKIDMNNYITLKLDTPAKYININKNDYVKLINEKDENDTYYGLVIKKEPEYIHLKTNLLCLTEEVNFDIKRIGKEEETSIYMLIDEEVNPLNDISSGSDPISYKVRPNHKFVGLNQIDNIKYKIADTIQVIDDTEIGIENINTEIENKKTLYASVVEQDITNKTLTFNTNEIINIKEGNTIIIRKRNSKHIIDDHITSNEDYFAEQAIVTKKKEQLQKKINDYYRKISRL